MDIEKKSVILIQKWVRGHIVRLFLEKQREINFKQMRKIRRLLSVAYGRIKTKIIK